MSLYGLTFDDASNRTNLELKLSLTNAFTPWIGLLIAPIWNRNFLKTMLAANLVIPF